MKITPLNIPPAYASGMQLPPNVNNSDFNKGATIY